MGNLILKQSKLMLEHKQQALWLAMVLSVVPFVSWLSVAIVALITLRKGARQGFEIMLPALVVHLIPLMMLVQWDSAVVNTVLEYLPCYAAALVLRQTAKWQYVFGAFVLQSLVCFALIQLFVPEFPAEQYQQFQELFAEYQDIIRTASEGINVTTLEQLLVGLQLVGIMASSLFSLSFARSIQSKLFLPGGFSEELAAFRCGKWSLLLLVAVSVASYYGLALGLCLLPLTASCFFLSGVNLLVNISGKRKQMTLMTLLALLLFTRPMLILLAFIVIGSLDSIFNFRIYLRNTERKTI